MSTQKTTTSTNQYNQASMQGFNQLQSPIISALLGNIQNPFSNSMFNTQLQMGKQGINAGLQAQMQRIGQNNQALGGGGNALLMSQIGQAQRGGQAANASLQNNLFLNAQQLRQQSLGQAQAYSPLQTGQQQTQKTTGLGTWLPQLAGAALGGLTGGMSNMFGGGGQQSGGAGFSGMANMAIQNQNLQPTYGNYGGLSDTYSNPFLQ